MDMGLKELFVECDGMMVWLEMATFVIVIGMVYWWNCDCWYGYESLVAVVCALWYVIEIAKI